MKLRKKKIRKKNKINKLIKKTREKKDCTKKKEMK